MGAVVIYVEYCDPPISAAQLYGGYIICARDVEDGPVVCVQFLVDPYDRSDLSVVLESVCWENRSEVGGGPYRIKCGCVWFLY